MKRHESLVGAMCPVGTLFLLITLPELRRQGLTYLALYSLIRTFQEAHPTAHEGFAIQDLRSETGLSDYEISRACSLLQSGGLVKILKTDGDRRERMLMPTTLGRKVLDRVFSAAGERLWEGMPPWARSRRVREASHHLAKAHEKLFGPLQLTFFDKHVGTATAKPKRGAKQLRGAASHERGAQAETRRKGKPVPAKRAAP